LSSSHEPARSAGFNMRIFRKRDFWAGALMVAFGMLMALKGPTYSVGTLMHMGPGFLPTALGVILIGIGVAISMMAVTVPDGEDEDILPAEPQWFAWACILLSPVAFIVFGSLGGLAPATFMCVFVAALGDKQATWLGSFGLSAIIAFFGVMLFHFVLQIPMPVLKFMGWSLL
jgi:Tripartite tricarboxylate transporter TctB family